MAPEEPDQRYTLAEARRIVKREQCRTNGHRLECGFMTKSWNGEVAIECWECANSCGVQVSLSYPD
jgi:hypothetical protein